MKPSDRTFVKIGLPVAQTIQCREFKIALVTFCRNRIGKFRVFLAMHTQLDLTLIFHDKGRDVAGTPSGGSISPVAAVDFASGG